jgi:hypothetical protein
MTHFFFIYKGKVSGKVFTTEPLSLSGDTFESIKSTVDNSDHLAGVAIWKIKCK